jgi:peptidoglycan/LPS O-acetylase OafA/YrhL
LAISILISIGSWITIPFFFKTNTYPIIYFVTNLWGAWCFGAWLAEKIIINHIDFVKNKYWWLIGLGLLIAYTLLKNNPLLSLMRYSICITLWAWFLVAFLKLENYFVKINKSSFKPFISIPIAIGVSSYSLYMLHIPLIYLRNILLQEIISNNTRLLLGGVWLIAILFLSYFSYLIFEKPFLTYRSK